ncbi:hypothetical protein BH23BAC3_BH23BAC3_30910 [soil metagenome]
MAEWKPQWKENDSSEPALSGYATADGNYTVVVGPSGIIRVVEDDWLSKYSAAIHGDMYDVENFYLRYNTKHREVFINNLDLIFEGERILHLPSYFAYQKWWQKLKEEQNDQPPVNPPEVLPPLDQDEQDSNVLGGIAVGSDIISAILEFVSGAARAGALFGILGQVIGTISNIKDWAEAWEPDYFAEGFYASIYAATAWTFDDLYKEAPLKRPTTDKGDYKYLAPESRFKVPPHVGDPNFWYERFKGIYANDSTRIMYVEQMGEKWQEAAEKTIEDIEKNVQASSFSIEEYRRRAITGILPNDSQDSTLAGEPYQLNRRQFFTLLWKRAEKNIRDDNPKKKTVKALRRDYPDGYWPPRENWWL